MVLLTRPTSALLSIERGASICPRCLHRLRWAPFVNRSISTLHNAGDSVAPRSSSRLSKTYFVPRHRIDANSDKWLAGARGTASFGGNPTQRILSLFARRSGDGLAVRSQRAQSQQQEETGFQSVATEEELPHRKRQRLKRLRDQQQTDDNGDLVMPLDASSQLSAISQSLPRKSLRRTAAAYLSLAKPRLSALILITTTTAYAVYPVPDVLSPTATTAPSLSALTLLYLSVGTALCCASANAFNMLLEPVHDAKMSRTRNRPLVRGLLSKRAALIFAVATGAIGAFTLYWGVNPTTSGLGAANIFLYAAVYTPMKRISAANTWAGALVGGIPPLMGWTAAAGQTATSPVEGSSPQWQQLLLGPDAAGGWLLAALLFAWQFPHFNALSFSIRHEYRLAGHKMLAWTNNARNTRVALRYSLLMFPICWGLAEAGVVEPAFVPLSGVVNGWVCWEAVRFWRFKGEMGSARGLFWASVWHLPVVMALMMVLKKGLWGRVWSSITGAGEEDEDDWED